MCISTRLCKIILQSSYANMCNWNKHWYWSCLFRTACSLALFVEVLCLAIDLKKPTLFVVAWQSCPSSLVNLTRIAPSSSTFLNSVLLRPHVFCPFIFRSLSFFIGSFLRFTTAAFCSPSDGRLSNWVLWQTWSCWAPFCSFPSLPCRCIAEGLRSSGKRPGAPSSPPRPPSHPAAAPRYPHSSPAVLQSFIFL